MFPIIGPANNYSVQTQEGEATLDQHGIARVLNYQNTFSSQTSATYVMKYEKNSQYKNPKHNNDSTRPENMFWPYSFKLTKTFNLTNKSLQINFQITRDDLMPFMFGYHPAFKLSDTMQEYIEINNKNVPLRDIMETGNEAYKIENCRNAILRTRDEKNVDVEVSTQGFDNLMLWAPSEHMVCIEPITHLPMPQKPINFNEIPSSKNSEFSVIIKPILESRVKC
ncbi:MAG: aldose 1-epimerase [Candidatus Nanoarchaeia archaeon]